MRLSVALWQTCVCVEWLCAVGWLKRLSTALLLLTARSILAWIRKFGWVGVQPADAWPHAYDVRTCVFPIRPAVRVCVSGHY